MAKTDVFISIGMDEQLLKRIDDYRFRERHTSRSEAIRELLKKALKQEEIP